MFFQFTGGSKVFKIVGQFSVKKFSYIKIVQVGSTKYKWYVGKEAISKDDLKYQNKKRKNDELFAQLVLEGISINNQDFKSKESGVFVLEGFEQDFEDEIVIQYGMTKKDIMVIYTCKKTKETFSCCQNF